MTSRLRHARIALSMTAAPLIVALAISGASAQSPAPAEQTPAAPAAETAPATPAPAPAAPETEPAAPKATETTPTPAAPAPEKAAEPAKTPEQKVQTADPFGQEMTLEPKTVVTLKGTAAWENAFEALSDSFKKLSAALAKSGTSPSGPFIVVYTATDDSGFTYLTEIPVDQEPKDLPKNFSIGKSPEGKVLKFVHRGSYDNMDNTYEAITNHLDEKQLEARDMFIEEYTTDPLKTSEDKLVINVFVPLK